MVDNYVPERGDLLWVNFNPQTGREQASKRPALALSPREYNQRSGLVLLCPITSQIKNYPFEVLIESKKVQGAVLSDHLKSIDWQARRASFIEKAKPIFLKRVQEKIVLLLGVNNNSFLS